MKKIIIIFIMLFLLTGCSDYKELNKLAVATSMGIDKKDNAYLVTLEILEVEKTFGEAEASHSPIILSSTGLSISDAINNINKQIPKELYLSSLEVLVLNKNLFNDNTNFLKFFITNTKYNMNPLVVLSDDSKAILSFDDQQKKYSTTSLKELIINSFDITGEVNLINVRRLYETSYQKTKEIIIPSIKINEESLTLSNNYCLKDNKITTMLSDKEIIFYNILTNKLKEADYEYHNHEKNISTVLINENSGLKVKLANNIPLIHVNLNLRVRFQEELNALNELPNLENELTKDINLFFSKMFNEQLDLFNLGDLYYKFYPKYFKGLNNWYDTFRLSKIKIKINMRLEGL